MYESKVVDHYSCGDFNSSNPCDWMELLSKIRRYLLRSLLL